MDFLEALFVVGISCVAVFVCVWFEDTIEPMFSKKFGKFLGTITSYSVALSATIPVVVYLLNGGLLK